MIRKIVLLFLILLSIAGGIWGITGIYQILTKGHGVVTNATTDVPWGIQISAYIFLVLVSTGCTFVNFFGHLVNPKAYAVIGPRLISLALLTVFGGLGALFLEMSWPTRMMNFFTSPSFTSPMAWMAYFYTVYIVSITLEYILLKKSTDSLTSKIVMWITVISGIVTHSTLGSIFGIVEARAYFYGPLTPIIFLAVAFLCGGATASIVAYTSGKKYRVLLQPLRKMVSIAIAIVFTLFVWRFIVGMTSGREGYEIFEIAAPKFWTISIILGCIVPFVLILSSSLRGLGWLLPIASIIVLITQFISRHTLFIVEGFKIPLFKSVWTPEVIAYTPSSVELSIVIAAFAFVLLLYSIADIAGVLESPHAVEEV